MCIDVKVWLATYYGVSSRDIDNILKDEKATSYLLTWSIFEQEIFNGFMETSKIKSIAKKLAKHYSDLDVEVIARDFHSRYQDANNYRHLIHKKDNSDFKLIIRKAFDDISESEKLELLFFVAYRYRNNIFHGNKKVEAWTKYTKQIGDCIIFITKIIDLNKKESIITKRNQ